jgi:hypothetical protein
MNDDRARRMDEAARWYRLGLALATAIPPDQFAYAYNLGCKMAALRGDTEPQEDTDPEDTEIRPQGPRWVAVEPVHRRKRLHADRSGVCSGYHRIGVKITPSWRHLWGMCFRLTRHPTPPSLIDVR